MFSNNLRIAINIPFFGEIDFLLIMTVVLGYSLDYALTRNSSTRMEFGHLDS
jgi:hypothetical protein